MSKTPKPEMHFYFDTVHYFLSRIYMYDICVTVFMLWAMFVCLFCPATNRYVSHYFSNCGV